MMEQLMDELLPPAKVEEERQRFLAVSGGNGGK